MVIFIEKGETDAMFDLFSLRYWNALVNSHLSDVVMVLTATILVLVDKPIRLAVNRVYRPKSKVLRFAVFVVLYSFGYAVLTVFAAKGVRWLLGVHHSTYIAPISLALLIVIGIGAARQKLL